MAAPHINDIGARFSTKRQIPPAVYGVATTDGAAIDRALIGMPQSCKIVANTGALVGATTVDVKLQHCATAGGAYTDYIPPRGVAADGALAQIVTANTLAEKNVDLSGALQFVRLRMTTAVATSMAAEAHIVFGGGNVVPQP